MQELMLLYVILFDIAEYLENTMFELRTRKDVKVMI